MSLQAGVSWALAIPGALLVLLPICVPRLRGDVGGRMLFAGIACLFGVFMWLGIYEEMRKPEEPTYSNPYQEPVDDYGGCPAGPRSC